MKPLLLVGCAMALGACEPAYGPGYYGGAYPSAPPVRYAQPPVYYAPQPQYYRAPPAYYQRQEPTRMHYYQGQWVPVPRETPGTTVSGGN